MQMELPGHFAHAHQVAFLLFRYPLVSVFVMECFWCQRDAASVSVLPRVLLQCHALSMRAIIFGVVVCRVLKLIPFGAPDFILRPEVISDCAPSDCVSAGDSDPQYLSCSSSVHPLAPVRPLPGSCSLFSFSFRFVLDRFAFVCAPTSPSPVVHRLPLTTRHPPFVTGGLSFVDGGPLPFNTS